MVRSREIHILCFFIGATKKKAATISSDSCNSSIDFVYCV
jgi:hypothetical protein